MKIKELTWEHLGAKKLRARIYGATALIEPIDGEGCALELHSDWSDDVKAWRHSSYKNAKAAALYVHERRVTQAAAFIERQDDAASLLILLARIREAAGDPLGKLMFDDLVDHIALLKSRADGERWRSPADLVAVPDGSKVFALVDDGGGDTVWVEATISRWMRDELDKTPGKKLLGWLPMPPDDCVEDEQ